ncbi:hypothetical protein [Aquipuribacter sp. MA13-6]|uniref:hypothetical protein n=1 Tax=unclassified Aquipuribacter TaxID=2635084 RepID=UPI003EEB9E95
MTTGRPVPAVVLVREWHDHRGGGGCCGGTAALAAVRENRTGPGRSPAPGCDAAAASATGTRAADRTAQLYLELRAALPDVDVTVADAGNWAWLLPSTYRAVRASGLTRRAAARAASRSTTPGAVLVDGRLLPGTEGQEPGVVAQRVRAVVQGRPGTLPV